ncbi:hypothetical protein PRZ48_013538 [Zasmidium cellare]|uniref:Uncharacterized protein n=1 Tax=Zasmidium cellare TaxID=395010 RepID=A0ABR0E1J9_ZASCE|nr:hypothetical protein PRZ48_013538 [Zasmidium cellare]
MGKNKGNLEYAWQRLMAICMLAQSLIPGDLMLRKSSTEFAARFGSYPMHDQRSHVSLNVETTKTLGQGGEEAKPWPGSMYPSTLSVGLWELRLIRAKKKCGEQLV